MTRSPRAIAQIIEEQMLRWRAQQKGSGGEVPEERRAAAALAVAHAVGSHGALIAQKVAADLSVPLFDREILQHIATNAKVRMQTVEMLDGHGPGRVEEYLTSLLRERGFHRSDYLRHLTEAVFAICQLGPCILAGHGAVHVVPRDHCMTVRLDAPVLSRAQTIATRDAVNLADAKELVRKVDGERARCHKTNFGKDVHDPMCYDVILDTSRFGVDASAAILLQAFGLRFGEVATG